MSTQPTEVAKNPVEVQTLAPDLFVRDGLEIADPGELLQQQGLDQLGQLVGTLSVVQGGVQDAAEGAIQDPAGSAIGSGRRPAGAGAERRDLSEVHRPDADPEHRASIGDLERLHRTRAPGSPHALPEVGGIAGAAATTADGRSRTWRTPTRTRSWRSPTAPSSSARTARCSTSSRCPPGSSAAGSPTQRSITCTPATRCAPSCWPSDGGAGTGASPPPLTIYFFKPEVFEAATKVLADLS